MEFYGDEERREVMEVLETGAFFRYNHEHIRQNRWKARELEAEVRKYTGASYAHAVSSGSTAVACALAGAGIGCGDHVIVPPFTYIATVEAVIFAGAVPVFAEIDETLCLSAEGIENALTPNTRAVMLVHMCGAAADMDSILAVCKKHNLVLIEDAGQALGAFYKGTSVGLFGKSGAYSFDFFKITTCGEGGLMVTNDEQVFRMADSYSDHGHNHEGNNRGMEQHPVLGFNYRLSELHAAVGLAQMRKIALIRDAKRKNHAYLKSKLSGISGIAFRHVPDPEGDSGTFLNILMLDTPTAQRAVKALADAGLGNVNYWFTNMYHFINQWEHLTHLKSAAPLYLHKIDLPQDYTNLQLPKTQEVIGRLISIGISTRWTEEQMDAYVKVFGEL
jgi:8-amino-3,8-dideoxy-alpha-D-manno-octulosonate transaminase